LQSNDDSSGKLPALGQIKPSGCVVVTSMVVVVVGDVVVVEVVVEAVVDFVLVVLVLVVLSVVVLFVVVLSVVVLSVVVLSVVVLSVVVLSVVVLLVVLGNAVVVGAELLLVVVLPEGELVFGGVTGDVPMDVFGQSNKLRGTHPCTNQWKTKFGAHSAWMAGDLSSSIHMKYVVQSAELLSGKIPDFSHKKVWPNTSSTEMQKIAKNKIEFIF
jgi:hypothetical protein